MDSSMCSPVVLKDFNPGQPAYLLRKSTGYEVEEVLVKTVGHKIITIDDGKRFYISESGYPLAADVHGGMSEQEMLCPDMAHAEAVRAALQARSDIIRLLSNPLYNFRPGRLEQMRALLEKDMKGETLVPLPAE